MKSGFSVIAILYETSIRIGPKLNSVPVWVYNRNLKINREVKVFIKERTRFYEGKDFTRAIECEINKSFV